MRELQHDASKCWDYVFNLIERIIIIIVGVNKFHPPPAYSPQIAQKIFKNTGAVLSINFTPDFSRVNIYMEIILSKYKSKQVARAVLLEICKTQATFSFSQVKSRLIDHMVDPVFYDTIEKAVLAPFLAQGLIEETAEIEIHNNKSYFIYKSRVFR
jgi:hypothetical protein